MTEVNRHALLLPKNARKMNLSELKRELEAIEERLAKVGEYL
ncbi:MAG: hypothetical protein SFV17_16495 [Candidatus Obscuribacter sp.]|nr:hypothetical protein [Candidatus Obscuribacter sp.]